MAEAEAAPYVAPVLDVSAKKRKVEDEAPAAQLPKYGEFKDDLHVEASQITEKLLDDWVTEAPKSGKDMVFTSLGRFKDKYKIVFRSGGILPLEGVRPGEYGDSVEITITDAAERAGMEIFNAWIAKKFLKRDSFDPKLKPSPEQMAENYKPLMARDGTIKVSSDKKNPTLFALYRHEGPMSKADKADLGGKPWDMMVIEIKNFYTKSLSSGVGARLVFLRADPRAGAEAPAPKIACDYDV